MMFGTRITTVFQSRWKAASWALGILVTAYCSVPAPDEADQASPLPPPPPHHSPWAKDPPR